MCRQKPCAMRSGQTHRKLAKLKTLQAAGAHNTKYHQRYDLKAYILLFWIIWVQRYFMKVYQSL